MEGNGKKILIAVIAILLIAGIAFVGLKTAGLIETKKEEPKQEEPRQEEPITHRDDLKDDLVFAFLKLENDKKNKIYSPLSIRYALQILAEGAEGESKEQLDAVLGEYNTNKHSAIEKHLGFGNALFIRDSYFKNVKQDYLDTVKEKYDADIIEDKFENADNVNAWIEERTLGMIKKMLKDNDVNDPDLKLIIVNALSIDMEWEHQFDGEGTHGGTFTKADGKTMTAQMMHETFEDDSLAYYMDDDVTAVRLNLKEYEGTKFEFYAIMPRGDLPSYVEKFTLEDFNKITADMKDASSNKDGVSLSIPRFDFEVDLQFVRDLRSLGIENIFDPAKAGLTKIVDKDVPPLFVGDAKHKAKIEFSEKGVKAAAVTVIMVKDSAMPVQKEPLRININKPFMFVIKDKQTNDIWFVGAVYEPEEVK